jgi:signal transduction histidine kinase
VQLQIIDNGVGFNTVDIGRSGFSVGMHSMRSRIERLAGILEIQSRPGETSIVARLPFDLKKVEL